MRKFTASSPQAEVVGQALLALIENIRAQDIQIPLQKHKLDQIQPTHWYPAQQLMNLYTDIAGGPNGRENLIAIGLKAGQTAVLPPNLDTLDKLLKSFDTAYRMNYRHVPAEDAYLVEFLGEGHVIVTNNTPTPDEVAYGILWGFAKMLAQGPFAVRIINDQGQPTEMNFQNSDQAQRFELLWGPSYQDLDKSP